MVGYSLVKLLRSTTIGQATTAFTYELEVYGMMGDHRIESIRDQIKTVTYGKQLRMTGGNNHAVRYMNQFNWIIISEDKYNELVVAWQLES